MEVMAGLVSFEAFLIGLEMASLLCLFTVSRLHVSVPMSSSYKHTHPIGLVILDTIILDSRPHFTFLTSLKALSSNTLTLCLQVRMSTYELEIHHSAHVSREEGRGPIARDWEARSARCLLELGSGCWWAQVSKSRRPSPTCF